jgi:capsule polysaccharide export protein KpsE/RkpR
MDEGREKMSGTTPKQISGQDSPVLDQIALEQQDLADVRKRQAENLRFLWERRGFLLRVTAAGFVLAILIVLLIPNSYTSTAQLMPPDSQSSSALAMVSALAGKGAVNLAGLTGDLLGLKSSGALFIGVLRSQTSQDRIIQQFDLQKIYGKPLISDARKALDAKTGITEDRKSGILAISVTDYSPERAAAIANAYVDELNSLVAQLSTSAAHRERVFLEDRLKLAKIDLDSAANQLAQFSSKNNTLDIQIEGKAMLDAAGSLAGQLIAAESQLQGLRQIYTDNNARVRALSARVEVLRKQMARFGGSQQNSQNNMLQSSLTNQDQADEPAAEKLASSPFPSIRNLPLLGAKYSDYYRNEKVQETIFELLTEQYELAKVQEAKETPSVKLLDPGRVPEKKSFPPRTLFVLLMTFLVFAVAAIWLMAVKAWTEVDAADPRKVLVLEIAGAVQASAPWKEQKEAVPGNWSQRIWSRFKSRRPPTDGLPVS